jgi:hypothetical protein
MKEGKVEYRSDIQEGFGELKKMILRPSTRIHVGQFVVCTGWCEWRSLSESGAFDRPGTSCGRS